MSMRCFMKRNNFTLPEMLTVIAVIVILAGILIPVLINARNRARSTDCAARQGQIGKIFAAALDKRDHKLISGTSGNKLWSKALLDAGLLPSLEVARCTA
ncbi:MAG: prepilin-type N-terminal cleavage/methylation domain-containing protein, partial [Lentisphaeria bacterium]|nr:prepilin-type N-terminal cleavage/methylation domain-containing protein [Lentisphaeria bacterium]